MNESNIIAIAHADAVRRPEIEKEILFICEYNEL